MPLLASAIPVENRETRFGPWPAFDGGMEHTATLNQLNERTLSASRSDSYREPRTFAGTHNSTWLLMMQFVCFLGYAKLHSTTLGDVTMLLAMLASAAGIFEGMCWFKRAQRMRGVNVALVSLIAMFFWALQMFVRNVVIF